MKPNDSHSADTNNPCTFFLFQTGLSAIILVMSFISNFKLPISLNFDVGIPLSIRLIGAFCMVLSIISIISYTIFFIHAFVKRKSFTIHLGMSYLFALFLYVNSELIESILSYNAGLYSLFWSFIGMMWFTAWLIYLYLSKKVEIIFPIPSRITRKRDYLPIIFIAFPSMVRISIVALIFF